MLKYIEKLQKKPEPIRRMVLLVLVATIMAIVIIIWLSTLSVRFSPEARNVEADLDTPSPFSVVKNNATDFYSNFINGIKDIQSQLK